MRVISTRQQGGKSKTAVMFPLVFSIRPNIGVRPLPVNWTKMLGKPSSDRRVKRYVANVKAWVKACDPGLCL